MCTCHSTWKRYYDQGITTPRSGSSFNPLAQLGEWSVLFWDVESNVGGLILQIFDGSNWCVLEFWGDLNFWICRFGVFLSPTSSNDIWWLWGCGESTRSHGDTQSYPSCGWPWLQQHITWLKKEWLAQMESLQCLILSSIVLTWFIPVIKW
jgi:hypothetical protein